MVSRNYTVPLFITTTVLSHISIILSHINNRTDDIFNKSFCPSSYPSLSNETLWQQKTTNVRHISGLGPLFLSFLLPLSLSAFSVFFFQAYPKSHLREKTLYTGASNGTRDKLKGLRIWDILFFFFFPQCTQIHTQIHWLNMFTVQRSPDVLALEKQESEMSSKKTS